MTEKKGLAAREKQKVGRVGATAVASMECATE